MFRKIIIFYVFGFLFLLNAAAVFALDTDDFYTANDLYGKGKYKPAVDIYKALESKGVVAGELYYNMGNAYFKLNNKGMAMLYYLRALKVMPRDTELLENISFLDEQLVDKVAKSTPGGVAGVIYGIRDFFSFSEFLAAVMFFYLLLIFLAVLRLFVFGLRKTCMFLSVVSVCGLVVTAFFASLSYYNNCALSKAVVVAPEAKLFYSPAVSDTPAFVVHEGLKLVVVKKKQSWVQVNIEDADMSGWTLDKNIMAV